MLKIRVLAVEDESIHADKLRMVLDTLGYELIDVISDPNQLLTMINATKPDVLLMDIDLGVEKTGIELVKEINDVHDIPTVYLTSYTDNQTFGEAKKTMPAAYVTKPYKAEDLIRAIELAVLAKQTSSTTILQQSKNVAAKKYLFIKNGNMLSKVATANIKLIEAYDKYCYIFTSDNKFMIKERLKNILLQLSSDVFCQVHRKYVINIDAIETIDLKKNEVVLMEKRISIGKTYKQDLLSNVSSIG